MLGLKTKPPTAHVEAAMDLQGSLEHGILIVKGLRFLRTVGMHKGQDISIVLSATVDTHELGGGRRVIREPQHTNLIGTSLSNTQTDRPCTTFLGRNLDARYSSARSMGPLAASRRDGWPARVNCDSQTPNPCGLCSIVTLCRVHRTSRIGFVLARPLEPGPRPGRAAHHGIWN